jgi:DNA invertase Pin-like site-specific DNA recombinase
MNDVAKIGVSHLHRIAYVYLRQSSPAQVEHNRESTERQYALASKAAALGWPSQQVIVIDEDLGVPGTGVVERSGFARLITEVALGHVGIVLGLEVSRLARNNADWYRLLDFAVSPIPSSVTATAFIIRRCSMIDWYSASRAP